MTALLPMAATVGIILAAAAVRGYSGFGFALIGVTGLSIVSAPAVAVPTVLVLELLVGLLLLPPVWGQISWRPVSALLAGAVLLTPVGALFLIHVPSDIARLGIGLAVGAAALLLIFANQTLVEPSRGATLATGGIAGLLNGAFGVSGPPIVLYFLGTNRGAAISRASMMACFLVLDAIAVASFAVGGLISRQVIVAVAICLPALALGSLLGHRAFHRSDGTRFRTRMLWMLCALAITTGIEGALALL